METQKPIGWRHIHWDATDSTNNRAAEFADDPANSGIVITADVQSQGRGQHGRRWQSAPGANLLMSVLLFPPPPLCRPPLLTALAALAVCETVELLLSMTPKIKWPNDVLVNQQKVCGILIESGLRPNHATPYFIIGLGLNVNTTRRDFEQMNLPHATSLAMLAGRNFDVAEVRSTLLHRMEQQYVEFCRASLTEVEAHWTTRIGLLNHFVTVELMDATEVQGTLIELSFSQITVLQPTTSISLRPEEIRHIR